MGSAMVAGLLDQGTHDIIVIDPAPDAAKLAGPRVSVRSGILGLPPGCHPEAILFAVKPQMAAAVLPAYCDIAKGAVAISIMAGITVASLRFWLGDGVTIVRAMPNTPAAIRQGITVATTSSVDAAPRELAGMILGSVGEVAWVEEESLLDAVTAVSGSGPAYVFLLAECMEQAGIKQGLPADLARRLARQTVTGAGNLLAADPSSAELLRRNVTSPGGTTAAALAVLLNTFPRALDEAIAAATARSRELSGGAGPPGLGN